MLRERGVITDVHPVKHTQGLATTHPVCLLDVRGCRLLKKLVMIYWEVHRSRRNARDL
jgi:hypothetical protein